MGAEMRKESRNLPDRRKAFKKMGKLLLAGGGALTVGYFALAREGAIDVWVEIGPVGNLPAGEFVSRVVLVVARGAWFDHRVERAIWIHRNPDDTVAVLSGICPHKTYNINRSRTNSATFVCPGHKSAFDSKGNVLSGPSPRPMDSLEHKIENGILMVRYQKFRSNTPIKEVFT